MYSGGWKVGAECMGEGTFITRAPDHPQSSFGTGSNGNRVRINFHSSTGSRGSRRRSKNQIFKIRGSKSDQQKVAKSVPGAPLNIKLDKSRCNHNYWSIRKRFGHLPQLWDSKNNELYTIL